MASNNEGTRLDEILPPEEILALENFVEAGILAAAAGSMARARRKAYFPSTIPVLDEADVIVESTFDE